VNTNGLHKTQVSARGRVLKPRRVAAAWMSAAFDAVFTAAGNDVLLTAPRLPV
jgi:hypothetical protein